MERKYNFKSHSPKNNDTAPAYGTLTELMMLLSLSGSEVIITVSPSDMLYNRLPLTIFVHFNYLILLILVVSLLFHHLKTTLVRHSTVYNSD